MIYLITQLGLWLFLTAAFAALAGWAAAALRAQPAEELALRERDKLMKDLLSISVDNAPNGVPVELDREMDTLRRRADLDAARVAELERALETARSHSSEATSRVAELERFHGIEDDRNDDHEELERLRAELAELNAERERTVDVEVTPVQDDSAALMAWRLRYFEQRARYLENNNHQPAPEPVMEAPAPAAEADPVAPLWEWRARVAEAQVEHYEDERRALLDAPLAEPETAAVEETAPFAADAEADMLLRWRMLYLEKRVAYLQGEQVAAEALPAAMSAEEAETWKWRSRYLEARTRHLEGRLGEAETKTGEAARRAADAEAVRETHLARIAELEAAPPVIIAPPPAPIAAPVADVAPQPLVPAGAERRPSGLAAPRNGAGDDLSLIEGISLLQHRTLNSLGIHHFDQIAAWTPANVAWVDQYLRLRGRISEEEWVEQAQALAREGVSAARKLAEEEAL